MTIKNSTMYLSLIAILAAGLILGFFLGDARSPIAKTVYLNNPKSDCAGANLSFTNDRTVKADISANDAVTLASPEAILWAEDAYLSGIELSSRNFNAEGAGSGWKITFYSNEKKATYEILIKDGESRGGEEKDAPKAIQTLKGKLTDSTVLARSFFSSYPADTEIISLKMYYDGNAKKFLWTIFFPSGSHTIDAET